MRMKTMRVTELIFWACAVLSIAEIVSCGKRKAHGLMRRHKSEKIMQGSKRDTSLSQVEDIYSRFSAISHGEATYYGNYPGGGACSLDPLSPLTNQPGWIKVAAGRADFQGSLGCGMCLEINGTGKGSGISPINGTLKGVVHDLCGGCEQGNLDLYFPGNGRWEISFKAIDCPIVPGKAGNIEFRLTGSTPSFIKLQARNTRVPVAGIEVLKYGKYSCLRRQDDNHFVGDRQGGVKVPMQIRVTAVTGEQRVAVITAIRNDINQPSNIQFSGAAAGGGPTNSKCVGQGDQPPYPPEGMIPLQILLPNTNNYNTTSVKPVGTGGVMRYSNNKILIKGPKKVQSAYSTFNQPAVNGTRNITTQAPVKPVSNVKARPGTDLTSRNSTIIYNSTASASSSNRAHNSTGASVPTLKAGTFKFGNSTQANNTHVTVNSTTIPANFSDSGIQKLKTVNSKQDDSKQHQIRGEKSQGGGSLSVDGDISHTTQRVNKGIRISIDQSDVRERPQSIGVTTNNPGPTTLSLTGLNGVSIKQGSLDEHKQNDETSNVGTKPSNIGITIGQEYKDHGHGVSLDSGSHDLTANGGSSVPNPSTIGITFRNQDNAIKLNGNSAVRFEDFPRFTSKSSDSPSKIGIVIKDKGKQGGSEVSCSTDENGSTAICVSNAAGVVNMVNDQGAESTFDNAKSSPKDAFVGITMKQRGATKHRIYVSKRHKLRKDHLNNPKD